jgi:hypothetical protein
MPVGRIEALAMIGDGRITSPWTLLALVLLQQRMRPA